jgi:hypothetical protein
LVYKKFIFFFGFFLGLKNLESDNYFFYSSFIIFVGFLFIIYNPYFLYGKLFLQFFWFYFVFILWFSSILVFLKKYSFFLVIVEERGFFLGFFIFVLEILGKIIQIMTLFLRITVNLLLGEIIKFFLSFLFFLFLAPLFFCFFEFFVFFVQSLVFFTLLVFYRLDI